ncbi:hypothetical protein [Thermus tengchongensis]|uniref:hypothetical protein n=1 Tax=Thermus tengchongensis TaxID=1214928 RepID=UPI001F1F9444|nr:hypothetical protein [Thermus tengchongensis]
MRLNLGTRPRLEWRGERLVPWVDRGREVRYEGVRYRGEVEVNLVGVWREGMREALWVMGNLPPEELLGVYGERMKMEEGFRDLKGHMGFAGVMSKGWEAMEKTLALVALAYGVGLFVLLRGPVRFSREEWEGILRQAMEVWWHRLFPVPPHPQEARDVRT